MGRHRTILGGVLTYLSYSPADESTHRLDCSSTVSASIEVQNS